MDGGTRSKSFRWNNAGITAGPKPLTFSTIDLPQFLGR